MHAELDHDVRAVAAFGEDSLERARFNCWQQQMFYDQQLTVYSAPVHMVTSKEGTSNPIDAYGVILPILGGAWKAGSGRTDDAKDSPTRQFGD